MSPHALLALLALLARTKKGHNNDITQNHKEFPQNIGCVEEV